MPLAAMANLLDGRDPAAIERAAQALAAGELVALPTETVYGLGARADDDAAVARIFAAKGRPSEHPLIVHVADAGAAERFAAELAPLAQRLIAAFWPGPLTLIVARRPGVAAAAAGGLPTIGLRCPSHPVAHALLARAATLGVPGVAAPSANRFGRVSPTRADHVAAEFGSELLIVDGGPCEVGIESTIIDCSRGRAVLLRPGMLARERIESVLGVPLGERDEHAPRASGTLEAHYAPQAKLRLMPAAMLRQALAVFDEAVPGSARGAAGGGPERRGGPTLGVYSRTVPARAGVVHRAMPDDAAAAARELFAALREFDAAGVQLIWVEDVPADASWDGVRDRLARAAAS